MDNNLTYDLFFCNDSQFGGLVCVYQDPRNVSANSMNGQTLAWMVCGADTGVEINFKWQVEYDFVWFNNASTVTQQIKDASVGAVTLSLKQYGYHFQPVTPSPKGALSIQSDASIPLENSTLVGIGMSGAGTLAFAALPNTNYGFTPISSTSLQYYVAFGGDFQLNCPIESSNPTCGPLPLSYPAGVYAMTVTLTSNNELVLSTGVPATDGTALKMQPRRSIVYLAGQSP